MQISLSLKVFLLFITVSKCAKILGIFPMPSKSHHFLGNTLLKALAEKGHDVTMISPFKEKNPTKNGTYVSIDVPGMIEREEQRRHGQNFFEMADISPLVALPMFMTFGQPFSENLLIEPKVQKLLNSNEKFDVVIVEQFMNEAHKGFASHFKAPLICFSTIGVNTWVNMLTGNPAPPSYIPDILLNYSSEMNFWQRAFNSVFQALAQLGYTYYSFPKQKTIYEKYFPKAGPFYDVLYNSSIVLLNSHPSISQPVPKVPSMIEIGGFHVQAPKKLPKELQDFLDNAKDGAIYFSMGSNIKGSDLPEKKRDAFLRAFAKLKQKVLWKWEDENLPGKPKNVMISKWFPQQDILGHPNVKLFITHGGLLSITETVYHGVPVMAIPIFGDQKINAQRMVTTGFGVALSIKDITEEALTEKLSEILNNPKYLKNAKIKSALFHDRLVSPMETAIYWVEYVIRHKGAPHLRVAGVDLPLYKYLLFDVIGFILIVTYGLLKLLKCICSLCCRTKTKEKVKQN